VNKREFLGALGVAAVAPWGAAHAAAGVTDGEILLGQSLDLSGPLAEMAPDIVNASKACFDAVNAQGGIHGRRIRMLTEDDGYKPENTVNNLRKMLGQDGVFALFNLTGTANVAAALPLLAQESPAVPLITPFTGADLVRAPGLDHVFNLRASYGDEVDKLVQHLTTIGVPRIAVLWVNNAFGKDGLAGVRKAMDKRGQKLHADAPIQADSSDVAQAVAALAAADPTAIILITAGAPTVSFIKAYRKHSRGARFYTLSVMGTQATLRALGEDGVGVVVTSVVPFPWSQSLPLAQGAHMLGLMQSQPLLISSLIEFAERHHGDAEIVSRRVEGDIHRYTYRDLAARSSQLANALDAHGLQFSDRVATLAWNGYRHMEMYFGVSGSGRVLHTINPRLHPDQIAWIVNHAEDQVLCFDITFLPLVQAVHAKCPTVKKWVALCDADKLPPTGIPGLVSYETWIGGASTDYAGPSFDENSASSMCYTSGTTGNPKAALYSHRSTTLHAYAAALPDVMCLSARDAVLPVVPMFHVNAWGIPYSAALTGCKLVFPGPALDGKSVYELIESEKVTYAAGVPTVWQMLLGHIKPAGLKFSAPSTAR
jgi:ABC-type branched-subunit amino acid transport system substrate-binding protein